MRGTQIPKAQVLGCQASAINLARSIGGLLIGLLLAWWAPASLAARHALVFGNDSYQNISKLRNARADAQAMADAFREVGYAVDLRMDRTQREMLDDLRAFRQRLRRDDEVVLYFSGHGSQIGSSNFLLPVNVRGQNEGQVRDDSLELTRVLADLREASPALTLAIIDACRNNPFPSTSKSLGKPGLTGVAGANGQMVIYAAGEGQIALDRLSDADPARNGVFTRVFIKEIRNAAAPVDQVLKQVRKEVARLAQGVGHVQIPAIYDQVIGDFYFVPDRRWLEDFTRADHSPLGEAKLEATLLSLAKSGNAIAAAELVASWSKPSDEEAARQLMQLAPIGLRTMQRLSDERQPKAMGWLSNLYLRGDKDLEVKEDVPLGEKLLEQAARAGDPASLQVVLGRVKDRDERIRRLTELARLGKHRYACAAMVGVNWMDPGETGIWNLAFSARERVIKSFQVNATGASYSAVGYPTGAVAVDWTSKAVELGCETASAFSVAHARDPFTPQEPGVPKDARRALEWYQRALSRGEEVGGWVLYRLFALHALGSSPIAPDPQKALGYLEKVFEVEDPEPWGLLDDLVGNPRFAVAHVGEFTRRYARWLLSGPEARRDTGQAANEAERLMELKLPAARIAAKLLCQQAATLDNGPCRQWLAAN